METGVMLLSGMLVEMVGAVLIKGTSSRRVSVVSVE
jgi:hypothetical protein